MQPAWHFRKQRFLWNGLLYNYTPTTPPTPLRRRQKRHQTHSSNDETAKCQTQTKTWHGGWDGIGYGHKNFPCIKYSLIYYSYHDSTILVLYFPALWIRLSEKYAYKSKSVVIMRMRLASYLSAPRLEILHDKTSLPQLISAATHLKDTSLIITQMFLTWEVLKCKTSGSTTI